ncbi:MAG TPA: ABC transporter permease [Candidatus Bathyarchaeia archaeon]|nr:ABC transporter permease [Candidatus Bathyarchaeia archaeon]
MNKFIKDSLIIAWMKSFPDLRRNPLMMVTVAFISAIPLFFMLIYAGEGMIVHGLVGAMVSTIGFIGVASAIGEISWDKYIKLREMMVAMPVSSLSYAMGIALAPLILSIPALAFFGAVATLWGIFTPTSALWTVAALLVCWASTSAASFLISTYLIKASPWLLNQISNILGIGLIFVPPVYYPETMLGSFSWISAVFPTSNAAGLIRVYLGLSEMPPTMIIIRWLILLSTTIVFIVLTSLKARWRET